MSRDLFFTRTNCQRCSGPLTIRTVSFFTEETICDKCSDKEQEVKKALRARGDDPLMFEGCGKVPQVGTKDETA